MAATPTAMLGQFVGTTWDNAFPQVGGTSQNLDLIQIVDDNGGKVLLNVDHAGVVHNPAVSPTYGSDGGDTRIGAYQTTLTSSATTAQLFANAFSNPSNLDIVQVITSNGGSIAKYIDYLGVSH